MFPIKRLDKIPPKRMDAQNVWEFIFSVENKNHRIEPKSLPSFIVRFRAIPSSTGQDYCPTLPVTSFVSIGEDIVPVEACRGLGVSPFISHYSCYVCTV